MKNCSFSQRCLLPAVAAMKVLHTSAISAMTLAAAFGTLEFDVVSGRGGLVLRINL